MAKFVLDKSENIMGKKENAGYQHFLHFPQCFQKAFSLRLFKLLLVILQNRPVWTNLLSCGKELKL